MERFNDLYGNCAQPIFSLIRICHLATAHLPIIYLVRIEQLFRHCESSKYLITVQRKILWQLQIAYLEIFRRFMCLLRKSPIFLLLRIIQTFCYCASPKYLLMQIEKIISTQEILCIFGYCEYKNFMTTSNRLFGNISTIYMVFAQSPIFRLLLFYFFLLRTYQLFIYRKSSNYFNTAKRLNIWLLWI